MKTRRNFIAATLASIAGVALSAVSRGAPAKDRQIATRGAVDLNRISSSDTLERLAANSPDTFEAIRASQGLYFAKQLAFYMPAFNQGEREEIVRVVFAEVVPGGRSWEQFPRGKVGMD